MNDLTDQSFMLHWRDLAGQLALPRLKFALRQRQWHRISEKRIGAKLTSVFDAFTHAGLRSGLLSANYGQAAMARVAE